VVADNTSILTTEPVTPHSHQKSKGYAGAPSLCSAGSLIHQQSPQQKTISANKRVSVHSPLCFPVSQQTTPGELLLPEGSYLTDSGGDVLVIGNDTSGDTNDDHKPISLILTSCQDIRFCNKQSVACKGHRYGSPLSKDCVSLKAPPGKAYSRPKETLDASLSSGSWTNNVDNVDMSLKSNTTVGRSSPRTIKPTTLFGTERPISTPWSNREEADILDGFWPRSHNITRLTHFVSCHFAGDWSAYSNFSHCADAQSLEQSGSEIHIDEWLSLKLPSVDDRNNKDDLLDYRKGALVHNQLCNKTVVDVIDSSQCNGTGTPPASWRKDKTPPGSSSSGHPDIRMMLPAIWARTPHNLATAQMMESDIALQKADKQARLNECSNRLGWDSLVEGRITTHWLKLVAPLHWRWSQYLLPMAWGCLFITKLHNVLHKQWVYRNSYIHYKGKEGWTMPQIQDVIGKVNKYSLLDPKTLLP
jgi:hypothetical protein